MNAGWPARALDALCREFVPRGLGSLVPLLAAEFPGYEFGMQRTWNGLSLVAVRRGGAGRAGTYAVITSDVSEMRHVLAREQAPRFRPLGHDNSATPSPKPREGTSCPVA